MKPIMQTRFGLPGEDGRMAEPPGNCWAACVASILELPLDAVPDEAEFWRPGMTPRQSWTLYMDHVHRWLHERGLVLIETRVSELFYEGPSDLFTPYCILSGPSPRNPAVSHAVVGRGIHVIHDPHESQRSLAGDPLKDWWYEFFVARNAADAAESEASEACDA